VVIEKDGRMKAWGEDARRGFNVEVVRGREGKRVDFVGERVEVRVSKP
jgi:hypothetical protein